MNDERLTPEQVNSIYPVIGARIFRGGIEVQRLSLVDREKRPISRAERGKIERLSKRSRSNLAFLAMNNARKFRTLMLLTYGVNFPRSGKRVKGDLNHMLTRLRQVYGKFTYIWFLEFQRRGAPHIHLLTGLAEPDQEVLKWFGSSWARIATRGMDFEYSAVSVVGQQIAPRASLSCFEAVYMFHSHRRAWEAVREKDGAARYAVKYALKTSQKRVPVAYQDVGRFWGASRDCSDLESEVVYGSEDMVRQLLWLKGRDMSEYEVLPKRIVCDMSGVQGLQNLDK